VTGREREDGQPPHPKPPPKSAPTVPSPLSLPLGQTNEATHQYSDLGEDGRIVGETPPSPPSSFSFFATISHRREIHKERVSGIAWVGRTVSTVLFLLLPFSFFFGRIPRSEPGRPNRDPRDGGPGIFSPLLEMIVEAVEVNLEREKIGETDGDRRAERNRTPPFFSLFFSSPSASCSRCDSCSPPMPRDLFFFPLFPSVRLVRRERIRLFPSLPFFPLENSASEVIEGRRCFPSLPSFFPPTFPLHRTHRRK